MIEAITAIVAVLKTGAGYVPIDPAWPQARVRFVVDDAAPVDGPDRRRCRGPCARWLIRRRGLAFPDPDNLAYLIYTSGTTGDAERCCRDASQRRSNCSAHWMLVCAPAPGQVWSQVHSYAFDVSVFEIWAALLHGGRLVVVPEAVTRSPTDLLALLAEQRCRRCSARPRRRLMRLQPPTRWKVNT